MLRVERRLSRRARCLAPCLAPCLALALASVGCSSEAAAPSSRKPEVAGEVSVPASVLDRIARERGISREQALDIVKEDTLLAERLARSDPHRAGWLERVVLARQLLTAFAEQARAGGPPSDAEVQAITDARFWVLSRPRMVRVVHAVVMSAQEDSEARDLAERIRNATSDAKDATEFLARARAVEAGKFSVKAESLPPVTPDGRAVDPASPPPAGPAVQHFDHDFTAAAQRLTRPGEQSTVVRTPFGYHVLYLVEVIEPSQPSLDERRALLHDEIMSQRATALATTLLEQQRRALQPSQTRSALASMQHLFEAGGSLQAPSSRDRRPGQR